VKIREQFSDTSQFREKKWIAYFALLAVSMVLFLAVGGSRRRVPDVIPPGSEGKSSGEVFQDLSDKLARLGETHPLDIDWEAIPDDVVPLYKSWGRDPFLSVRDQGVINQERVPDLHLSAISWKNGEAIVLINDFILKRGETIQGVEVVEIYPRSVVLRRGSERIILGLHGGG
jgi:hypothetical protein